MQNQILDTYYADNARKLRMTVDRILYKFGGIYGKDLDDFYSLANEVFTDVLKRYDQEQSFDGYLYVCLLNKIKSEMTRRNSYKRGADRNAIPMDTPIGENGDNTIADLLADKADVESSIFGEKEEGFSMKMLLYLSRLSKKQKEILRFLIAGYSPKEIQAALHLSEKEYSECNAQIHSYKNVSILF